MWRRGRGHWAPTQWMRVCLLHSHRGCSALVVDAGGRSPIPPCWSVASGGALAVALVFRPGREGGCHGVALLVCRCNACCAGAVDRRYAQERRKCRFFCIDFRLSQKPVRSGLLQAPNTQPAQGGLKSVRWGGRRADLARICRACALHMPCAGRQRLKQGSRPRRLRLQTCGSALEVAVVVGPGGQGGLRVHGGYSLCLFNAAVGCRVDG